MPRSRLAIIALLGAMLLAYVYGVGSYALLEPDEGRNAEVAREMAATGDYVLPRLNGLPYLDKPVLYFAASAVSVKIAGPTAWAARLPSLFFTLGTVVLVAWFANRHLDATSAVTAAVVVLSTPFTLAYSRTVIFDAALTFFVTLALLSFYEAVQARDSRGPYWRATGWGAVALGVLTKGPIALALPLLVAVPFAAWRRRLRTLADGTSLLLFVAIVLPWVYVVSQEIPGYLHYVVVTETALRIGTDALGRSEPWWYFFVILPAAALPWSIVVAARRRLAAPDAADERKQLVRFCLIWIVVPLLFFSLSRSKRPQYVLPLLPSLGILVAALWQGRKHFDGARAGAIALMVAGSGFVVLRSTIGGWVSASPTVAAEIPRVALALGLVCLVAGVVAWIGRTSRGWALLGLALPVTAIPIVSLDLMRAIGDDRSTASMAAAIDHAVGGNEYQVVAIEVYPLSLPFYLRRTLILASDSGVELTSNYLVRHFAQWNRGPTTRSADWWNEALLACTRTRVFIVAVDNHAVQTRLAAALPVIAVNRKYAAYGPCGRTELAVN